MKKSVGKYARVGTERWSKLCASTMRFILASSMKMACFMDTVRSLGPLSMKRADFMDISNIS